MVKALQDRRPRSRARFGPSLGLGAARAGVRGDAGRSGERREGRGLDRRALCRGLRQQGLDVSRLDRIMHLHVASLHVEPIAFGARLFLALEAKERTVTDDRARSRAEDAVWISVCPHPEEAYADWFPSFGQTRICAKRFQAQAWRRVLTPEEANPPVSDLPPWLAIESSRRDSRKENP